MREGDGLSSRVADLDLKAEKVTLAQEQAVTPPVLPCARTALTRTPALTHTRTRTRIQAALLATLQGKPPLRGALARGEAAQPGRAHSAGLGAPVPAGRERGAWPPAPAEAAWRRAERKRERSGGPGGQGLGRGDAATSLPAPPAVLSASARCSPAAAGLARLEKRAAPGACARGAELRRGRCGEPKRPGATGGGARAPPALACRGRPLLRAPPGPSRQPRARRRGWRRTGTGAGCFCASRMGRVEF